MQSDHFTIVDDRASTLPTIGRHAIGNYLVGGLILENSPVSFLRGPPLLAKHKLDSLRVLRYVVVAISLEEGVAVNRKKLLLFHVDLADVAAWSDRQTFTIWGSLLYPLL